VKVFRWNWKKRWKIFPRKSRNFGEKNYRLSRNCILCTGTPFVDGAVNESLREFAHSVMTTCWSCSTESSPAVHCLLKGFSNSVIEWFYVRGIRRHMFGSSMKSDVLASQIRHGVLAVRRRVVLLQAPRVALASSTNIG